ncbi:Uncharacterised protein [Serratia marcescens]|nr:Uncharacterised protein [Serratia marcescens]
MWSSCDWLARSSSAMCFLSASRSASSSRTAAGLAAAMNSASLPTPPPANCRWNASDTVATGWDWLLTIVLPVRLIPHGPGVAAIAAAFSSLNLSMHHLRLCRVQSAELVIAIRCESNAKFSIFFFCDTFPVMPATVSTVPVAHFPIDRVGRCRRPGVNSSPRSRTFARSIIWAL